MLYHRRPRPIRQGIFGKGSDHIGVDMRRRGRRRPRGGVLSGFSQDRVYLFVEFQFHLIFSQGPQSV